jgi:hypothetical protein
MFSPIFFCFKATALSAINRQRQGCMRSTQQQQQQQQPLGMLGNVSAAASRRRTMKSAGRLQDLPDCTLTSIQQTDIP